MTNLSQCSTVVRNCYKGDVASQWEIAIFGHLGLRSDFDAYRLAHPWVAAALTSVDPAHTGCASLYPSKAVLSWLKSAFSDRTSCISISIVTVVVIVTAAAAAAVAVRVEWIGSLTVVVGSFITYKCSVMVIVTRQLGSHIKQHKSKCDTSWWGLPQHQANNI